jgi:hypothetical protein
MGTPDPSPPLLLPVSALSPEAVDAVQALMVRPFAGVSRAHFDADLDRKNRVILLRDPSGALEGFSTLRVRDDQDGRRPCSVIYSGDTRVDPRAWGSTASSGGGSRPSSASGPNGSPAPALLAPPHLRVPDLPLPPPLPEAVLPPP